jgi:hypothetical protein
MIFLNMTHDYILKFIEFFGYYINFYNSNQILASREKEWTTTTPSHKRRLLQVFPIKKKPLQKLSPISGEGNYELIPSST